MTKHKQKSKFPPLLTVISALAVITLVITAVMFSDHNKTIARKSRIESIYRSLNLGSDYTLTGSDVFGDKRVYPYDAGRSFSSSKTYLHDAAVSDTVSQLRKSIEVAGFHYFEEPYPGAASTQLHFKSAKNEYIRLNVSSKPYDDATLGKHIGAAALSLDRNAAPSNVIIKVNLDDNNE